MIYRMNRMLASRQFVQDGGQHPQKGGRPASNCRYEVLKRGTNGLPVKTRAIASSAPIAFFRAVEM